MVLNLFLVALLILLTAFFVATEFAIIKLRPSRVDQMVIEGKKNALAVQKVTTNLDAYLSACQLGITITALALGWLGEPTVEALLHPIFEQLNVSESLAHILSFGIAFVLMTYLHVVLGELAPKSLAIQKAEQITVICAPIIIVFHKVMFPFIWLLNGSANTMIKLFGMKPASEHEEAHSEEEIRIILSESYESGKINKTEFGYVNRIFTFDELLAREIMIPRTDMVCLYADKTLTENMSIIKKEQYTRFPVAKESKDNIIGIINTKQFFLSYDNNPNFDFSALLQPVMTVPEVMPIKRLLTKMQQEQVHIALLLDEYGGTSGLITIEDILEEIVGEIRDEFDKDEKRDIEMLEPDRYMVKGTVLVDELNYILQTDIQHDEVDSIGGWLYSQQPELQKGEPWDYENLTFIIREKERHRIRKIEILKKHTQNV
ncbi:CBS domain containing-hemolysin-like protein [Paenibacillus phyllosphaerae]|uniref:CBS domain containing-hemolysin-like protein n=1 Tax=Paenibacillus phyllosphaerae TaxID=274593 RepID=A0A7W5AYP7_9BACL|nr:hemolysin family protein [Paenibacillus phyllosphaerae]MBB3111225.1 CBS domain containing-hemolysin-like protein [Paenibacillus phyllosphaerae]